MNDPELVVLDEPMSGLDPFGRRLVRDVVLGLKAEGKTVLFSTHILPDAETLCDRVGLLKDGRLVNAGRLDEILRLSVSHVEVLVAGLEDSARERLPDSVTVGVALGERWRLEVAEKELGRTITAVEALGGRVLAAQPVRQSLEQYFFEQVGADSGGRSEWLQD
jgi:ABC-2 type transport system ATP-binding protein